MSKKKDWFKPKGYVHLTNRINSKDRKKLTSLVQNTEYISRHAFFPLLHKKNIERKYKVVGFDDQIDKKIRSHKMEKNDKVESTKKIRPIHYATHIDAQIYAYYSNEILQVKYEEYLKKHPILDKCITAYRRISLENGNGNKSNIHFAKEIFDFIKDKGECSAMAFDIKSFFTNLNHSLIKKSWCKLLGTKSLPKNHYNIFKSITRFSYVQLDDLRQNKMSFNEKELAQNRQKGINAFFLSPNRLRDEIKAGNLPIYKNQRKNDNGELIGIPQGLPISAMLANLYMLEFDKVACEKIINEKKGLYRRYSDDIVVVCDEKDKEDVSNFLISEIKKFHLKIAEDKTEICTFKKVNINGIEKLQSFSMNQLDKEVLRPFNYLGFEFYGDKVLIKSKNIAKFYRRMKQSIKSKSKRLEKVQQKYLIPMPPIYKRKLYRTYTYHGRKSRVWNKKYTRWKKDCATGLYTHYRVDDKYRFRGNYLNYVNRASVIMEEPKIKKQLRNHWKIMQKYMNNKF